MTDPISAPIADSSSSPDGLAQEVIEKIRVSTIAESDLRRRECILEPTLLLKCMIALLTIINVCQLGNEYFYKSGRIF
jgi:hypothetical protein